MQVALPWQVAESAALQPGIKEVVKGLLKTSSSTKI
jgi:hypothetical protein